VNSNAFSLGWFDFQTIFSLIELLSLPIKITLIKIIMNIARSYVNYSQIEYTAQKISDIILIVSILILLQLRGGGLI
jgi:hypothetical protein